MYKLQLRFSTHNCRQSTKHLCKDCDWGKAANKAHLKKSSDKVNNADNHLLNSVQKIYQFFVVLISRETVKFTDFHTICDLIRLFVCWVFHLFACLLLPSFIHMFYYNVSPNFVRFIVNAFFNIVSAHPSL